MAAVASAITEVRFGRLQFATTRSHRPNATPHTTCHLALTLAAVSAELHWCPAASAVLTNPHVPAARVVGLVRAGRLWIGSGGRAVELVVHVQVTDEGQAAAEARRKKRKKPVPRPPPAHFLDRLAEAVTEWSGWEDELGLTVRRCDGGETGETGETGEATEFSGAATSNTLRFLVSKPATPGGLCAPPVPASYGRHGDSSGEDGSTKTGSIGIPQAQLRRVECRVVYDALPAEVVAVTAAAESAALLREKKRKMAAKGAPTAARRPTRQQPLRTRRAIVPPLLSAVDLLTADEADDDEEKEEEEEEENPNIPRRWPGAVALIEAALSTLVGVRRRRVPGVRPVSWTTVAPTTDSRKAANSITAAAANGAPQYLASAVSSDPYLSLLDMAPAVWSAHYGQTVTAHAAYIPTLSRLLATSAMNAQGAHLQQKVHAMGGGDVAKLMATIETRLHELVLKEVPALPSRRVVQKRCAARKAGAKVGDNASNQSVLRRQRGLDDQGKRAVASAQDGKTPRHMVVLHPTPPPDESQESDVYNICMDDLDAILATDEYDGEVLRDGGSEPDKTGNYETDWREIEAWSELDGWPAEDDDPVGGHGWDENDEGDTYGEEGAGQWQAVGEYEAFEQEAMSGCEDPFVDYDDDGEDEEDICCTDWQDVEDWQLEAWAAGGSVQNDGI